MTEVFQVSTQEGTDYYVKEIEYARFLYATQELVKHQRAALRTRDKQSIAACKKREKALLEFVEDYRRYRASLNKAGA